MIRAAAALLLASAAAPALADSPRPLMQPKSDVTVIYAMTHGAAQIQQRSRWQAATGLQRVDTPQGGAGYMIANRKSGVADMVNTATRQVIELKVPVGPLDGGPATFEKLGSRTIAGHTCTEWSVTPANAPAAATNQLCLTDDGILLGVRTGEIQRAQAIEVTYGPADPAIFIVPPDFARVTPQVKAPISRQ